MSSSNPLNYCVILQARVFCALFAAISIGAISYSLTLESGTAVILGLAAALCTVMGDLLFKRANEKSIAKVAPPSVIWFTGLPSSGKTTLSLLLKEELKRLGHPVEHLDGDAVRAIVPGIGFSRDARNDHIRRMGFTCSRLEAHGVTVIASFVSPYRESRDFVRGLCKNFVEVYLSTDLVECERRDVKGLYKQVKDGSRAGMTGVDDPYEPPAHAELVLDTAKQSKEECVRLILERIGIQVAAGNRINARLAEKCHGSSVAA